MAPTKSKGVQCTVQAIDCMIALNITPDTTGKQLIDMIFTQLHIFEKHWFGLLYYDQRDNLRWLEMDKKINLKDVKPFSETSAHFKFTIRFFPESVKVELIQDEVKGLFFKYELSRLVTDPDVEILPEHRILCAVAYACLVAHEHPNVKAVDVINKKFERIFPPRVLNNFELSKQEWMDAILPSLEISMAQHYTEPLQQALEAMEQSPMHGVSYYAIRNKNGTDLLLGIDCYGLSIYKPQDRMNPRVAFMWQEIHSVSYTGKAFNIKPLSKDDPPLVIYTQSARQNDEILSLIAGNHMNYLRRRQDDPLLLQEVKEAKSAQMVHDEEKKRFEKQKEANAQYENKVNKIMEGGAGQQEKEKQLQEEFNRTKELMEKQIAEAKRIAEEERLKKDQAERETDELRRQALEMEKKLLEDKKAKETIALLEAERQTQEQARQQEVEALKKLLQDLENQHNEDIKKLSSIQKDMEAKSKAAPAKFPVPGKSAAASYEEQKKQKNAQMKEHLNKVGTLMKQRNKDESSSVGQIQQYAEAGKDKFETLKMIRKNNTKARIDEFESY